VSVNAMMSEWSLILTPGGGEWSASCPVLPQGEKASSTNCLGGWMGLRAGLDTGEEKNLMPLLV